MHNDQAVLLAESCGLGRVCLCSCGAVHLKIGPVTMNLTPEGFAQAAAMVEEAAKRLAQAGVSKPVDKATAQREQSNFLN